jgi:hypothetical protein
LNVVSSPRGAIKKRYGSTIFASELSGFPAVVVKDTFERGAEKPLSDGAKWTVVHGDANTGEITETAWNPTGEGVSGAYWNAGEQTNPAASVELYNPGGSESGAKETYCGLWVCLAAAARSGYFIRVSSPPNFELTVAKWIAGIEIPLRTLRPSLLEGDFLGVTVRGGVIRVWRQREGVATQITSVADATYTKGFVGVEAKYGGSTAIPRLRNFGYGETPAPATEAEFTSLLPCKTAGGNFLVAAGGTRLFSINEAGEITEIGSGFTEGKRWSLIQAAEGTRVAKGPVYLSNGTDAPQSWTGAAKGTATTAWTSKAEGEFNEVPKAKYMTYHGNRIWATGVTADSSAVRWSGFAAKAGEGEVADPTDWPKANVVWLEKDDGLPITGINTVGPYVLVFKAHQTWVIYDLNEGENRQISGTTGCIANRSIVETPVGTFFLSPDQGVFVTNGAKVQEVSRNVRNLLQGQDPIKGREDRAAKLNELETAAAGYLNGHYYLSYMAQDGSMKTLDYDLQLKSWWLHDLAGNQWVVWEATVDAPALYLALRKAKTGIIRAFVPGVYSDSGATYKGKQFEVNQHEEETVKVTLAAFWSSCWEPFWQYFMRHRFQQPQIKKRIRTLFLDGSGEVEGYAWRNFKELPQRLLGVTEKADIATEATYTPTPGSSEETEYQAVRFYSLGTGRVWSFMFANQTAEPFEIDTYAADLYFRKG